MTLKRWQDWANLLLGICLLLSPMALGFWNTEPTAAGNAWLLGAAIVVFASFAVNMPQVWEEATNVLLGIWLMVSPWVLDFSAHTAASASTMLIGLLVTIFALWAMALDTDVRRWMHEHHLMR